MPCLLGGSHASQAQMGPSWWSGRESSGVDVWICGIFTLAGGGCGVHGGDYAFFCTTVGPLGRSCYFSDPLLEKTDANEHK